MLNPKRIFPLLLLALALGIIGCSSQEYTTAKLAIQQSDWVKAAEWLPKAMAVEPDNPEIPIILGIEIYAQNKEWDKMNEMFDNAMSINSDKIVEVRNTFLPVKEVVKIIESIFGRNHLMRVWNIIERFKMIQIIVLHILKELLVNLKMQF